MRLGIIVVSFNVRDLLEACLASVLADLDRSPGIHGHVVVVDNASADDSAGMVAAAFPGVDLIASPQNLGFARGNNMALAALGFGGGNVADRPDAILLLNPDTEVQPGALSALAGFLASVPGAGGCGPRLNYGDGSFQHSAFHFPGLMQLALDLFPVHARLANTRLNGRYPRAAYDAGKPFSIDFALGAALMVRATAIDDAGLLDEGYFMYAEEMDWCHRLQDTGWPLYCVPAARITHFEGRSARQFRGTMTVALWRSRLRYYDRYYPRWKQRAARRLIGAGMSAEMRRTRAAYRRGDISAAERDQRMEAYRQVMALVRQPSA